MLKESISDSHMQKRRWSVYLIYIYCVPNAVKVFRYGKVTQESGQDPDFGQLCVLGQIIQLLLLNFQSWERKALHHVISETLSTFQLYQFRILCITTGP